MSTEAQDFSSREHAIVEHVTANPGIIKEKVVEAMDGKLSRVTTYKTLARLILDGIILEKKDKPNSQTHHLFINNENLYVTINAEIKKLKKFIQSKHTPIKEIIDILKKDVHIGYGGREFKLYLSHILHYRQTIELMIYRLIRFTYKVHSDYLSHNLREDIMIVFSELASQMDPLIDYLGDYELSVQQEELESIEKENKKLKEELESIEKEKGLQSSLGPLPIEKGFKDTPQGQELIRTYKTKLRSGMVREHFNTLLLEMRVSIRNYRTDFKQRFGQAKMAD